jgi:hypothetical protein
MTLIALLLVVPQPDAAVESWLRDSDRLRADHPPQLWPTPDWVRSRCDLATKEAAQRWIKTLAHLDLRPSRLEAIKVLERAEAGGKATISVEETWVRPPAPRRPGARPGPDGEEAERRVDKPRYALVKDASGWKIERVDFPCRDLQKTCGACKGEGWVAGTWVAARPAILEADAFKPRTDRSTARAAAEAYADAFFQAVLASSAAERRGTEAWLKLAKDRLAEPLWKPTAEALDRALDEGKKLVRAFDGKPLEVEEKGEAATAIVKTPHGLRQRLSLKKSADGWRVDGIETLCHGCEGKGCSVCGQKGGFVE